jgi:hypothetical protein
VTPPVVTRTRLAGDEHQVLTVEGGAAREYRRRPCGGCPWRVDQTGTFPSEAFLHSAETAYDMATHQFACHEAGTDRPKTCAGYLLRGADHNLSARLAVADGRVDPDQVSDGGLMLHEDYRTMAVANGCDPDDPRLRLCR